MTIQPTASFGVIFRAHYGRVIVVAKAVKDLMRLTADQAFTPCLPSMSVLQDSEGFKRANGSIHCASRDWPLVLRRLQTLML